MSLTAVVFLTYGGNLATPLGSDARFLTYGNEWVRSDSGIARFWTSDMFEGAETHGVPYLSGYYRPILNSFFWLEYRWAGSRDVLYNAMEVLLHGLNAFLVLLLVTGLFRSRSAGLVAGVLFATHPVNAFAAIEPAARGDVLFTLFYLSAMLLFMRALDRTEPGSRAPVLELGGVGLLYLLSLLSKEMGITLPAALVLLVLYRHARDGGVAHRWRWTLPVWALLAGYVVWRFLILDLDPGTLGYAESHGTGALLTATLATLPVHAARLIVPAWPTYPELLPHMVVVVGRGLADPLVWVALALLALLGAVLVRWRRDPDLAFCAGFFLISYSPLLRVDNIAGALGTNVILTQERWIYLPAVAFLAAIGIGVARLAPRVARPGLVPAGVAVVAVTLAWAAALHAGRHNDPFARLRRLYVVPEHHLGRFELANRNLLYASWVALPSGDLDDAEDRARAALELVPDSPITAHGLAAVVAARGGWEEVVRLLVPWMYPTPEFLEDSYATNPRVYDDWNRVNPQVALLLGRAVGHLGDVEAASAYLCDSLRRGVSPTGVENAVDEVPGLEGPLDCRV